MMFATTYSALRQNLTTVLQRVLDDRLPCVVSRRGHEDVVILPRSDWESIEETLYLLSSSNNARRLEESRAQAARGDVQEWPLPPLS